MKKVFERTGGGRPPCLRWAEGTLNMKCHFVAALFAVVASPLHADETKPVTAPDEDAEETVVITGERSTNLVGRADSASQGTVGPEQLKRRPLLRPGELLETVPGLIISQHSGSGKANQFYLRGFNLDHGTDLATSLDGVPINFPTHAHGHGYTDINFLIPELVQGITYRKGAYRAAQGDFSAAGSVDISYFRRMGHQRPEVSYGGNGYKRILLSGSPQNLKSDLVYGLELSTYDGPWVLPEDLRKINGVLRWSHGDEKRRLTLTGMGYRGKWNSTDQVPQRAIDNGTIPRFGFVDATDGGDTHRYSLNAQWHSEGEKTRTEANAYALDYKLNLFSNFTYFLDDPVRGDQFEQAERRRVFGANISHKTDGDWNGRALQNEVGLQLRHDRLSPVGLYNTQGRTRFNTVREDRVNQTSFAPYFENRVRWTPKFRTVAGLRYDNYRFDVNSSIAANSGNTSDALLSPKINFIFGPFKNSELYVSAARAFHSNDARGTTITIDPKTGAPAQPVTPLVKANEAEIGWRFGNSKLQSTVSLWTLNLDSELLFVGDAGTTEASRPSRRNGIEWTNYYSPKPWLTFDADFALSRARFSDNDPAGNRIPGAVEGVIALGAAVEHPKGYFGALRLRYFGPRPLIEDNSVRSSSSALVNARIGYRFKNRTRVSLDVFNLLNAKVSDIDYFYESRLPGEPLGGVADIHTHPAESRTLRVAVTRDF